MVVKKQLGQQQSRPRGDPEPDVKGKLQDLDSQQVFLDADTMTATHQHAPATPTIVIGVEGTSPFEPSPYTAKLLGEAADEHVFAAACKKFASRCTKYGIVPTCTAQDAVWQVARLPFLCSVLARVMTGRLPFSEHRHFLQQSLLPKLLHPGDAFMLFQEQELAVRAAGGKFGPEAYANNHKMLVYVGDNMDALEVNAQRCTSILEFAWPQCKGVVPSYTLDVVNCNTCDMVQFQDAVQMARALCNVAATYIMRPEGCVTAFYYIGRYLAPVPSVLELTHGLIKFVFDLDDAGSN